jgi:hypothetical protein
VSHPQRPAAAGGEVQDIQSLCRLEALPEDIRGSLQRRFSDWKIQGPTDLSGSARERWAAETPMTCPGIAVGHFLTRKDTAYALLLIPVDRSDPECALVIFTQASAKGIYSYKVVDNAETGGSDYFILSAPTSKYLQDQSIVKSQSFPADSVLLVAAGAKTEARVFYWANDAYQKQQANY